MPAAKPAKLLHVDPSSGPRIVVPPPGPKSQAAIARRDQFVARGHRTTLPIEVVRAGGSFLEDVDGNRYVDLGGGIGVHNAGHRPASVIRAAKDELDRLTHLCYMVTAYKPYTDLAERLASLAPRGLTKSMFVNSGSEAIENSIKLARAHTKKPWIASFKTAFHGRTLLTLSLNGKEKPYREGFGPFPQEVLQTDYPNTYRDPESTPAGCAKARVDELEAAITAPRVNGKVGALVVEPVQGEGGMIVPPKEFFPLLRKLCDKHGMVLIDDEVQAGLGRTGMWWGIDQWRTTPDIIVTGKALGGGLPIAGVTGKPDIMESAQPGALGGTFGGNPVSCAAALEALNEIEKVLPKVGPLATAIGERLAKIKAAQPRVGDVRGIGGMWALEFVRDPKTKEPDADLAKRVQTEGLRRGLVLITAGFYNNCVRLLPPLNIALPLLAQALDLLADAIEAAVRATPAKAV